MMDISDLSNADLRSHLVGACDDIKSALARGKFVLVHCQQV
jgi:protein-tyrosine phosphatase